VILPSSSKYQSSQQPPPPPPLPPPISTATINNDNDIIDSLFDHKLNIITAGLRPFLKEHLLTKISRENCSTIISYIMAMQTETNLSDDYRLNSISTLKQLSERHNSKSFKNMTRQDILDFLDRYRKPESVDPIHKWIGTYEIYRIIFLRFFKWLHYPDLSQDKRPKPAVMENINKIKRREISIYKPTDLWTEEDDVIFYKYCPSVRDRCWHAVSRDTGARPIELLRLKIKDVVIQQLGDGGYQIAKITVNGKTGVRNVRLYNSYPFLKEWLSMGHHPFPSNSNASLFCGIGKKNTGRRISREAMQAVYRHYKKNHFPKLLEDPTVLEEDKRKIKDLLQKPWNLYIRRHTAATEISKKLKDSVLTDQYMGWSHAGNTRQKYQHYYSDDGIEAMLLADGLTTVSSTASGKNGKNKNLLKPKACPNCNENNKPESKFCVKCKYVLSYDGFNEAIEEKAKAASETEEMKKKIEEMQAGLDHRIKENGENNVLMKNLALELARLSEEMEADRKRIEELDKREAMLVAFLEERRREAEQQS
jgi:integrase/recombinase XerD